MLMIIPGNYVPHELGFWVLLQPDKFVHLVLFGGLSVLIAYDLLVQYKNSKYRYIVVVIIVLTGIIVGVGTEMLQKHCVTGRNGNMYDAAADLVGSIIGCLGYLLVELKKTRNREQE